MAQLISGTTIDGHSAIHAGNLASHSIATTSYVTTQINNLINGAPGALNTLDELAAALGDDASFATSVTNSLAGKLSNDADSEQDVGGRYFRFNNGGNRINIDPRWNESGYDADMGVFHMYSTTAAGAQWGRTGLALYTGSAYQYLTTKANTTGIFLNDREILTTGNIGSYALTSYSETDPTVPAHVKSITTTEKSNWNTAYGWGNHASAGYLTALPSHNHDDRYYTETEINNFSYWRNDEERRVKILLFTGEGGNSANTTQSYAIYQAGGAWTHPYPDLRIAFHTGIQIGANSSYGGTRFYNEYDMVTELMSVGNGDNHVRVANNLYVTGTITGSEIQLNAGLYLQTYNDRNLIIKGNSSSDAGIEGRNAAGNNVFQIYGNGTDYGFLNGTWAAWDIRKTKNAAMYMNNDSTYYLQTNSTSNFVALNIQGNAVVHAGNIGSQSVSYATTSGSAGAVTGLTLTSSANNLNPDNVTQNQIGYNTSVSLFGQTDGGLYSSAYSSSWIHQIYGDFRTGQIAIRGKNSGSWQAWRVVLDSSNYTSYAPSLTGSGASGSWGISVTGSAGSVAWTNVSSRPTALSQFSNDLGNYGGFLTSLPSHTHDDRYYTESESDSRFVNADGDSMSGSLTIGAGAAYVGTHGTWTGEQNKIQWHSTHLYLQNTGGGNFFFRRADGTNLFNLDNNGSLIISGDLYPNGQGTYRLYVANSGLWTNGNFGASGDLYLGTRSTWLSSWLNQSVQTGASPSFANVYLTGIVGNNSSQTRDKLRVWDSSQYTIGMKSGYNYGHLGNAEYAMSFQMNDNSGRGFWWGDTNHSDDQGAASLTTDGRMVIATSLSIGEGESTVTPSSTTLYVKGSTDGADVLAVDGVNGRLFTITDSVLDTIYSVNTIAGLPILEVLANSTVKLGPFSAPIVINASGISTPSHGTSANWFTAFNKRPTGIGFSGSSTKTLTLTLGDGSTLTAAFNDIDTDTDTNTDGQTLSISGSTLTISGGNSITIPSGGISQATADGLYQPLENQRLSTGNSPTFVDIYANEWFRNNNNLEGLYNQANGNHFYSRGGSKWGITGNGGNIHLEFRSNHESTLRGVVYADTSNQIGFLNNGEGWALRANSSNNVFVHGTDLTINADNAGASNINMNDGDEGARIIHCNSNRIGFLTQAGSWGAYCDDSGNWVAANFSGSSSGTNTGDQTNISGNAATATNVAWTGVTSRPTALSQFSNDLGNYGGWITSSGSISGTAARATRANGNFYIDDNYGNTVVGVYASTRLQGVFAMGDSYKLPADGTSAGALYGMAWSHPNAGGVAANLNTHGLLVMENGTFLAAISGSIRARDDMRAPAIYDNGSRVAISRGEGVDYVNYSRYVYNNGAYSGTGWIEPSDLGVRYANSAGSAPNGANSNSAYNVTPGEGHGIKFWNSDSYKISMGSSGLYQYGPVTDYSIKMQMDDGSPGRGFTWGRESYAPIAGLNATSGNMQIAGTFNSSNFSGSSSGTNTGDQTNISGNAATATALTSMNISQFTNNSGYITSPGNITRLWAESHAGDYYIRNNWTGTHWHITSNHGSGVRVAYADDAGYATSAGSAGSAGYARYLPNNYNGDVRTNPQSYFDYQQGLNVAMTGAWSVWSDTLWINGYSGGDVPWMCALHFLRNSEPRMAISAQTREAAAYGTYYEVITAYNIASQSVSYASTAGNTNSISSAVGGSYTWTSTNYFRSNLGATSGALSSPPLQVYCTGGNSAFMSFHRSGNYAVNFGLDSDNVLRMGGWSASANRWQLDMSGNMTVAGDVTAFSDARVKTNVQTIENALDKTLALRGVSYNRTDSDDTRTKIGVIAQETLEVVPEVVNQDASGMYNVSYGNMTALLIEAIKEQQAQIEDLKLEVKKLRGE